MNLQVFYDIVKTVHDNIGNIKVTHYDNSWSTQKFEPDVNVIIEGTWHDGYEFFCFKTDKFELILSPDHFSFIINPNNDGRMEKIVEIITSDIEVVDLDSYFQYSMIEDLKSVPWEYFPMITAIQKYLFIDNCLF